MVKTHFPKPSANKSLTEQFTCKLEDLHHLENSFSSEVAQAPEQM